MYKSLVAWVDDMYASSRIAKLVSDNSYNLELIDGLDIIKDKKLEILILDLSCIDDSTLSEIISFKNKNFFILLGFCNDLNHKLINYYYNMGFEIIMPRREFLNNLHFIFRNFFDAY